VEDSLHLYTNTVEKHDIPDMRIDPFQERCKKYIKLHTPETTTATFNKEMNLTKPLECQE
jgi:hypothetical protein